MATRWQQQATCDGTGVTGALVVDTGFNASSVNDVNVGVSFIGGIAKPEIHGRTGTPILPGSALTDYSIVKHVYFCSLC